MPFSLTQELSSVKKRTEKAGLGMLTYTHLLGICGRVKDAARYEGGWVRIRRGWMLTVRFYRTPPAFGIPLINEGDKGWCGFTAKPIPSKHPKTQVSG